MARERVVSGESAGEEEERLNYALRPQRFEQFVGQEGLIRKLRIAVEAARGRGEPVEHTLLHGPPGLGKTTLAHVIANEMGATVHVTSGPALTRAVDLIGVLSRLQRGDVLFVDEIHRLAPAVEEYLYPAMEDFRVDIMLDQGPHARTVPMKLNPFTMIGATTRLGLLTAPMRGRFGIGHHLDFYEPAALLTILQANAKSLGVKAQSNALGELAGRSRGTPRIANRLLRRVRDFAAVEGSGVVDLAVTRTALQLEGIDGKGMDEQDRQFLKTLIEVYEGGPAGVEALAATMGQEIDTLVDVIEPYLLQSGLVMRTRQGRRATRAAYEHLGLPYRPKAEGNGEGLFETESG